MKELNLDYFQQILALFKLAPRHFYSPCGRTINITKNEINIRSYMAPSEARISVNEIIFRKLWEITKLEQSYWQDSIVNVLAFFKTLNYTDETIYLITETLKAELLYLINSKERVMHNPF